MQKNFKYLIWLIIIISYSAFGLITEELSSSSSANYNATGIIINKNYKSDLEITPNIIRTYRYVECNAVEELTKNNTIQKLTDINKYDNTLFVLIPREYGITTKPSYDISSDQILRMNEYLNVNYLSPRVKNKNTITINQDLISTEIQSYLQSFNDYLIEQQLTNNFSVDKKAIIDKSIVGSYGLFMPPSMQILNKFNGHGRTLQLAVSVIKDLLITADDFTADDTAITKDQFINSQYLIFKAMELAKTVIFLPELTAHKNTGEIRLPIALINKVSLDANSGQITLNLLFCHQATNNYLGFDKFINARNTLLRIDDKATEWEFIDYIFELDSNDNLISLKYKVVASEIKDNGYINELDNHMYHEAVNENMQPEPQNQQFSNIATNEEHLLDECRLPDTEELTNIKLHENNNSAIFGLFSDLLSDYDYASEAINNKLFDKENGDNITTEQQNILVEELIKYKNHNLKKQCKHYDRKCLVKLDCCDEYWCCHREHNNFTENPSCNKKAKSANISFIKCLICNYEQTFSESCQQCNTKFADYYCGICKHLTDKSTEPFHCEKCGICRTYGDRSFHCDTCGLCLDVSLRGNHKCRQGSAHDECCICLEDAFTGCQILPCSHKVHKACSQQMIEKGITRCPICRASFANKIKKQRPSRR